MTNSPRLPTRSHVAHTSSSSTPSIPYVISILHAILVILSIDVVEASKFQSRHHVLLPRPRLPTRRTHLRKYLYLQQTECRSDHPIWVNFSRMVFPDIIITCHANCKSLISTVTKTCICSSDHHNNNTHRPGFTGNARQ